MGDIIIVAILALAVVWALYSCLRRKEGGCPGCSSGGCCGGGCCGKCPGKKDGAEK